MSLVRNYWRIPVHFHIQILVSVHLYMYFVLSIVSVVTCILKWGLFARDISTGTRWYVYLHVYLHFYFCIDLICHMSLKVQHARLHAVLVCCNCTFPQCTSTCTIGGVGVAWGLSPLPRIFPQKWGNIVEEREKRKKE